MSKGRPCFHVSKEGPCRPIFSDDGFKFLYNSRLGYASRGRETCGRIRSSQAGTSVPRHSTAFGRRYRPVRCRFVRRVGGFGRRPSEKNACRGGLRGWSVGRFFVSQGSVAFGRSGKCPIRYVVGTGVPSECPMPRADIGCRRHAGLRHRFLAVFRSGHLVGEIATFPGSYRRIV